MIQEYTLKTNPPAEKLTVLKFWAKWCGPCGIYKPLFENVTNEVTDVDFQTVDVDKNPALAQLNNVSSIPCTLFFYKGKEVGRISGLVIEHALKDAIVKIKVQEGIE